MPIVPKIDGLDIAWIGERLGLDDLTSMTMTSVGSGQVANCYRLSLARGDEFVTTVIAKVPSNDEVSRATANAQCLYEREVSFYQLLAPLVSTRTPACFFAERDDEGNFLLLLEDLSPAADVDQFAGITLDMARTGLASLAGLHGPTHARHDLHGAPWLGGVSQSLQLLYSAIVPLLFDQFLERYAERIDDDTRQVVTRVQQLLELFSGYESPQPCVVHGDFRTDNLLIGAGGGEVPMAVVDWQTISAGSPLLDVAYFLTTSLSLEDCARHEHEPLDFYLDALAQFGVEYSAELARAEFARYTLQPIVMLVCASVLVEQTERGDKMFLEMIERGSRRRRDETHCTNWSAMLLASDDYPLHQSVLPIAHVMDGHPNAYDRFWFNGYTEDFFFAVALGLYPNRGVIDGAFSVVQGDRQFPVFASDALVGRPTEVGPIRVKILEPLRVNRIIVDAPEQGLRCELTYTQRTATSEEPRQTMHDGARIFMDATRATQLGPGVAGLRPPTAASNSTRACSGPRTGHGASARSASRSPVRRASAYPNCASSGLPCTSTAVACTT